MSENPGLAKLREEIHETTVDIIRLVGRRRRIAKQIGFQKSLIGLPLEDKEREEILHRLVNDQCDRLGIRRDLGDSLLELLLTDSERAQKQALDKLEKHNPKRIAVVGGGGGMGTVFARYFKQQGDEVIIFDTSSQRARKASENTGSSVAETLQEAVNDVHIVVVAVPLEETLKTIIELASLMRLGSVLIEISSIKDESADTLRRLALGKFAPLSLHPLFGPGAITPQDQSMAVIPVLNGEDELELAQELFPECTLFIVNPEAQDKMAGLTMGLVYYMNMAFASMLAEHDIAQLQKLGGPSFRLQLLLSKALITQNPRLYMALIDRWDEDRNLLLEFARRIKRFSREGDIPERTRERLCEQLSAESQVCSAYDFVYRLHDLLFR